jgi:DNA primase catalytic subunit
MHINPARFDSRMEPILFARSLQYYKRREVQEAILRHAQDREVSPRYGEGFGKRPDTITYPTDILEFAKRKATSFHVSEERWENPLDIKTGASRKEMNTLRKGWDLVLDIDAKDWEISRLTAWLFIESLKAHGIKSISVKFSGNKGWHIGVPFEAFPPTIFDGSNDILTKDLFPELPRAIAGYLLDYMDKPEHGLISFDQEKIIFGKSFRTYSLTAFSAMGKKTPVDILETFCNACQKRINLSEEQYFLFCKSCGHKGEQKFSKNEKEMLDDNFRVCPKCKHVMDFEVMKKKSCPHDPKTYQKQLKLQEMIEIDTVLLASRHLYRMAYSLHEKSGLVSVVIDPDTVFDFKKESADPKVASFDKTFLDTTSVVRNEGAMLLAKAWEWQQKREEQSSRKHTTELEVATEAISEEHFPPCMQLILQGMADGKKRAMFALTNFLSVAGWSPEMIEKRLYEWNEKNGTKGEPLREVIIKGHMHNVRMKRDKILPPNCKSFYQELGVCKPNEFCSTIRNPGQYALKHVKLGEKRKKSIKAQQESP